MRTTRVSDGEFVIVNEKGEKEGAVLRSTDLANDTRLIDVGKLKNPGNTDLWSARSSLAC